MRYQDVQLLSNAIEGMRKNILAQKMAAQQEEQRQLDNRLKQEMVNYQRERDRVADERYVDNVKYGRGRDSLMDGRWRDEFDYRRGRDARGDTIVDRDFTYRQGRDAVADARDTRNFSYQQGRDVATDDRADRQLSLQAMAAKLQADARNRATQIDDVDPITNQVQSRRITRPYLGGDQPGGLGASPTPPRQMSAQDQQALQWAQSNPNDPRAAAILRRLGMQ